MTNKTWQPEHRFESSAGTVAYDVRGTGEPLVLVHGTPASSYLWRGVVDRLTDRFRVYTYDLPGYGRSDRYEGQDVSNPMQARVLGELL
uniref:alpha/beta fold hydrolase n=1 Tax=Sciscionella sediminilitoris TaxID=1445613 RepID=UPI0004DF417F